MRTLSRRILPLAMGLALVLPASAWAQGRGHAHGQDKKAKQTPVIVLDDDRDGDDDWDDRDRDDGRIVLRHGARTIILHDDDFLWYPVRSDRGPSFCRTGAGHPVFGLQWCLNKGYGIGTPGTVFLRDGDVFLRDRARVIVVQDRARDADRVFWTAVVGQILAWAD